MRSILLSAVFLSIISGQSVDHATLAKELNRRVLQLRSAGTPADFELMSRQAVEHADKAGHPEILSYCLHNRALILRELHRYQEAEPIHRRVLAILEDSKASPQSIAIALQSLASLLVSLHHPSDAEPLLLRAARFPIHQNSPLVFALILNSLGEVQYFLGKDRDAENTFRRAIAVHAAIRALPPDNEFRYALGSGETTGRLLALILNNQGLVAYRLGQKRQAEACWRRSIQLYRQIPGEASGAVGAPIANLAELLRFKKQFSEASKLLVEALSMFEKSFGPDSFRVALILNLLGNAFMETGDLTQARLSYDRALILTKQFAGEGHSHAGIILSNLAELEVRQGTYTGALVFYDRSLEILEKALGQTHPQLIPVLTGQASLLRKIGRSKDAKRLEARRNSIQTGFPKSGMVSLEDLQNGR